MNKDILDYINTLQGYLTALKTLHWSADSLSQHKLCDDIASDISDFEDLVSEVEQSISGKIKHNEFKPKSYKISTLKVFIEDVISDSQAFLKELERMGNKYIGIKSECESFIGTMQRNLYLVNFTLKEEMKMRIREMVLEAKPKNLANVDSVEKFKGRKASLYTTRKKRIYSVVKKYGINSKLYTDDNWQAIDDYITAIEDSLDCDVNINPFNDHNDDSNREQFSIKITFDDGMVMDGYIKCFFNGDEDGYRTDIMLWSREEK